MNLVDTGLSERANACLAASLRAIPLYNLIKAIIGQQFGWHRDGSFRRDNNKLSLFTFMIDLNDGYEGGATCFDDDGPAYSHLGTFSITPERGMALLFHHPIHHRGDRLVRGRKYVLRSDVMYRRIG